MKTSPYEMAGMMSDMASHWLAANTRRAVPTTIVEELEARHARLVKTYPDAADEIAWASKILDRVHNYNISKR